MTDTIAVPTSWNPVKELKVISSGAYARTHSSIVESGEGIER